MIMCERVCSLRRKCLVSSSFSLAGCVSLCPSSLLHDSRHCLCFLCLHVPSGHASQCRGLLLRVPESSQHGTWAGTTALLNYFFLSSRVCDWETWCKSDEILGQNTMKIHKPFFKISVALFWGGGGGGVTITV